MQQTVHRSLGQAGEVSTFPNGRAGTIGVGPGIGRAVRE